MANFYPPKKIIKYLKAVLIIFQIPFLCLAYLFLQILKRIAPGVAYKIVTSKMLGPLGINQWNNSEDIRSVDDMNFMFSSEIFKFIFSSGIKDAMKDADLGAPAPDVPVMNILSRKTVNLLSLASKGRPLVLNFGSCS